MAEILQGPVLKIVKCNNCSSIIGYLPEDIERHDGKDYTGGADGYERVKCPRPKCPGHGYIKAW